MTGGNGSSALRYLKSCIINLGSSKVRQNEWLALSSFYLQKGLVMKKDKIRPSVRWYVLSAAIVIVGAMLWLVFFFILFFEVKGSIHQIVVPGVHELELQASGRYIIYHEYQSVVGNKIFSTDKNAILGLQCSIRTADRAEKVEISPTSPHAKYEFGGKRKGVSIFEFEIGGPGTYILTAKYSNGREKPQVVLGVARSLFEALLVPGLFLMLFTTCTILLSGGIFWITFFKRRRAKKRLLD